ncbi:MAG: hypothetical protein RLZZ292_11 [Bacteroidota bacterium]|jgi:hypothetical protein
MKIFFLFINFIFLFFNIIQAQNPPCGFNLSIEQSNCQNNNTEKDASDDYFTVTILASNPDVTTKKYLVFFNNNLVASSKYNEKVVIGNDKSFKADGVSTYTITIQDESEVSCSQQRTTKVVESCSIPKPCNLAFSFVQSGCQNNGTERDPNDDFYTTEIMASNGTTTTSKYNVFVGTNTIAEGKYGEPLNLGADKPFRADGQTTYTIGVKDQANPGCFLEKAMKVVQSCSNVVVPPCNNIQEIVLKPINDATVASDKPEQNFGKKAYVSMEYNAERIQNSFMRFYATQLVGKQIVTAKLRLRESVGTTKGATYFNVKNVSNAWNETTINYKNQPNVENATIGSFAGIVPMPEDTIIEIPIDPSKLLIKNSQINIAVLARFISIIAGTELGFGSRESQYPPQLILGVCQASCAISNLNVTVGSCNPATNKYSIAGQVTFSEPPTSGNLVINAGNATYTLYQPFMGNSRNFSIQGLTSNGETQSITAYFTSLPNCKSISSFIAPVACNGTNCKIDALTLNVGACNTQNNTYTVEGKITVNDPPVKGTLKITLGNNSKILNAPFKNAIDFYFSNLPTDGTNQVVTAVFSENENCKASKDYIAPTPCIVVEEFKPTKIPGLKLWLDAAESSTLSLGADNTVNGWKDRSNSNNNLSNSNVERSPKVQYGALNNKPVVRFDGKDDYLAKVTGGLVGTKTTVFIVANSAKVGSKLLETGGNSPRTIVHEDNSMRLLNVTNPNYVVGQHRLFSAVSEDTKTKTYIQGKNEVVGTITPFAASIAPTVLGSSATYTQPLQGDIAEVLVYDAALSETQRKNVEMYLLEKWFAGTYIANPSDISDLVLWLDASETSTLVQTDDAISEWKDRSGKNNNFTNSNPARRPKAIANALSSKPVIRFDGKDDYLSKDNSNLVKDVTTIIMVLKSNTTGRKIFDTNGSSRMVSHETKGIQLLGFSNPAYSIGTYKLVTSIYNGASNSVFVQGTSEVSGPMGGLGNSGLLNVLGARTNLSDAMDGDIAEILVFSRALTDLQRKGIELYLQKKWFTNN